MNRIMSPIIIGFLLLSLSMSIKADEEFAESDSSLAYFDKTPFKNSTMFILKVNWDIRAKYRSASVDYSVTSHVDRNISINSELLFKEIMKIRWGIGIQLQIPRSTPQIIGSFHFNSLYAHIIAYPFLENDFPYIVARIGLNRFQRAYGIRDYDYSYHILENGLYYAFGVGTARKLKKGLILGELVLSYNNGYEKTPESQNDIRYSRLIITLGYGFK